MAGIQTGLTDTQLLASQLKAHELVGQDLATQADLNALALGTGNLTASQVTTINNLSGLTSNAADIDSTVAKIDNKASLTTTKNLFDVTKVTDGFFMSQNGAAVANSTYCYSAKIPVEPLSAYVMNGKTRFTAYYDKSGIVTTGGSSSELPAFSIITIPSNVYFIVVTVYTAGKSSYQFEKGTSATVYEPYTDPYLKLSKLVKPVETEMFEKTKNLFDKYNSIIGSFINWGSGFPQVSEIYSCSGYIEIIPSTSYYISGNGNIGYLAWYTSAGVFISGNEAYTFPITSPSNAKYIRMTSRTNNISTAQLEANTVATAYAEPYILKTRYLPTSSVISPWIGKKAGSFGDSITAQNLWQPAIAITHNITIANYGVGGTTIAGGGTTSFAEGTRVAALPTDLDLILVMGGTNDWAQNILLGSINDNTTATFYGALNVLIQLLLTKYPTKRIVFMTTPYGEIYSYELRGWDNAYTNKCTDSNNNVFKYTTDDYAEAVRQACKKHKIPYVDINAEAGWNTHNIRSYITDDGGLLHPNTLGASKISNLVSDKLYSL